MSALISKQNKDINWLLSTLQDKPVGGPINHWHKNYYTQVEPENMY